MQVLPPPPSVGGNGGLFDLGGLSALAASLGLAADAAPELYRMAPEPAQGPPSSLGGLDLSSLSALAGALGVVPASEQFPQQPSAPRQFAVIPQPGFSISLVTVEADGSVNSGPLPPGPMPPTLFVVRGDRMMTAAELGSDFLDHLARDAATALQSGSPVVRPAEELLLQESWALLQKTRAMQMGGVSVAPEPPGPAGPMRRATPAGERGALPRLEYIGCAAEGRVTYGLGGTPPVRPCASVPNPNARARPHTCATARHGPLSFPLGQDPSACPTIRVWPDPTRKTTTRTSTTASPSMMPSATAAVG